jgi:hypothetical protein
MRFDEDISAEMSDLDSYIILSLSFATDAFDLKYKYWTDKASDDKSLGGYSARDVNNCQRETLSFSRSLYLNNRYRKAQSEEHDGRFGNWKEGGEQGMAIA